MARFEADGNVIGIVGTITHLHTHIHTHTHTPAATAIAIANAKDSHNACICGGKHHRHILKTSLTHTHTLLMFECVIV